LSRKRWDGLVFGSRTLRIAFPFVEIPAFGTVMTVLKAVPEPFWQFEQWHAPTKIGLASPE